MNALRSVRARITLGATVLVALTLTFTSVLIVGQVERDVVRAAEETLDDALALQAEALGADPDGFQAFEVTVDDRILGLGLFVEGDEGVAFGELYEGDQVVADLFIDPTSGEVLEVFEPGTTQPTEDPAIVDALNELAFDALSIEADSAGSLLVGATALDEVDASVHAVRQALLITVPLLTVAFAAMVWLLVGRALRPVQAITAEVEELSVSNLHRRVPVPPGSDEITDLATVMNQMLDRLEAGGRRQRQFSADASHELRSPLTTVRTAAEIIASEPGHSRSQELADDIVAEADRMNELIGALLALARGDEGLGPEGFKPVDLGTVVTGELAYETARGDVTLEVNPRVMVWGAPDQLRRVVRNMANNAASHRKSQTHIRVTSSDGHALIQIDDDGPGVPEIDRQRIFERFTRSDPARSRNSGGAGLGLALVAGIVAQHSGTIQVHRSDALGGACFVVRFPLLAIPAP